MGISIVRAIRRRLKRDAIRDLVAAGWTTDELATLLGVSTRRVEQERAAIREIECRLRQMAELRKAMLDGFD